MPRVTFNLDEQFSDLRSSEVAYKFTIENGGQLPIELLSITPRIPEEVALVEVKQASLATVKAKYADLCSELTELLARYLFVSSNELRQKLLEMQKGQLSEASKVFFNPLRVMFTNTMNRIIEQEARDNRAFRFKIDSVKDAQLAYTQWFNGNEPGNKIIAEMFKAKLNQLELLATDAGVDLKSASIATIEPGSLFSMTYILKFPRYSLSPRKFNMAIEANYSEADKKYVGGAASSIIISPRPLTITLLAVFSSLMGVVLKVAIDREKIGGDLRSEILQAVTGSQGIAAVILAIIFFNVFEYTDIGKKFSLGVGWRSALLIGALCGIGGDRILAAIKALLFGSP